MSLDSRPSRVALLAESTPDSRNRVVDLLRAAAILVVVLGHWTVAAVYVDDAGELRRGDLLELATWTHPLTWVVQVMPVFFLVGGYANALSWRSARTRGTTYGGWLRARLRRLTIPVLPLMLFWAVVAPVAHALGAERGDAPHRQPSVPGADLVPGGVRRRRVGRPAHPAAVGALGVGERRRTGWRWAAWSTT